MLRIAHVMPNGAVGTAKVPEMDTAFLAWLYHMVETYPDAVFFFTEETTDVFDSLALFEREYLNATDPQYNSRTKD